MCDGIIKLVAGDADGANLSICPAFLCEVLPLASMRRRLRMDDQRPLILPDCLQRPHLKSASFVPSPLACEQETFLYREQKIREGKQERFIMSGREESFQPGRHWPGLRGRCQVRLNLRRTIARSPWPSQRAELPLGSRPLPGKLPLDWHMPLATFGACFSTP
jgi:hypothetical protein